MTWNASTIADHALTSRMSISWSIFSACRPPPAAGAAAGLDRHRPRPDAGQNLPRQRIRNHAARGGIQHQRRGIRRRQPVVEPIDRKLAIEGT
jgi:hypothetical protein